MLSDEVEDNVTWDWPWLWKRIFAVDYAVGQSNWLVLIYGHSVLIRQEDMIVFTCSGGQVDSAAHAVFAFPLLDPFWQYASDIAAAWMPGFARVPHIRNLVEYVHGWPSTYQALQGLDKLRMQLVYTASLTALKETRLRMRIDFDLDQARARVLTEILSVRLSSTKLFDNTPFSSNQAASVDQIQNLVRIATETRIALA